MQSAKEVMLRTLNRSRAERAPCAPHWWGLYKYETLGLDYRSEAWRDGDGLAPVYEGFHRAFEPDWFHLHIGTPRYFRDCSVAHRNGKARLVIDPRYRPLKQADKYFSWNSGGDEEIVDFADYLLGSRADRPKADLRSLESVDDYVERFLHMDAGLIEEMGYPDHVKRIADRYGRDVFIAVHIPSAVCEIFDPITGYVGFEAGLIALHDRPEGMMRLFEKCYESQLEWAKAYARAGAHAYVISESYISPETAGPEVYRRFLKPIHRDHFAEVERMGLIPILDFWGDVNPILDDLTEINAKALMFEESKKTFTLDAHELSERAGGRVCLFGNIDSITLLHDGTVAEVRDEVKRQWKGAAGYFVIANGSPITPGTPARNVRAMIETAKEELGP